MRTLNDRLARFAPAAPVVIRLLVGGVMAYHGVEKFRGGLEGVEGFFAASGVPLPGLTGPLVAFLEVAGGLAVMAGFATRIASAALAVILLGAVVFVKSDLGVISSGPMPGAELDLALVAGLTALVLLGPGPASLDRAVGFDEAPAGRGEPVPA